MEDNVLLSLKGIDICREENQVLSDISLTVHQGEFV